MLDKLQELFSPVSGQLPQRKIAPEENYPMDNCPPDNCPQEKLPPG